MYFLEPLGIWVIYAFAIGTGIWAVAYVILIFVADHLRKKDYEEWMRTEGYAQMRVTHLCMKEDLEAAGVHYEDEFTKYATYDEAKKAKEEEKTETAQAAKAHRQRIREMATI